MSGPTSLITLASGRLTPLNRLALTLGLGLFAATILLVRPVHESAPRLVMQHSTARVLDRSSPLLDRAFLQEGGSLFMPSTQPDMRGIDSAQPDASPFQAFAPEFRQDPNKPLSLSPNDADGHWLGLDEVFPLADERPLATIGQKPARALPKVAGLTIQVFSESNEIVTSRSFSPSDPLIKNHKDLIVRSLRSLTIVELRLGVDMYGLESSPYLLHSSGDRDVDRLASDWAKGLPWAVWLKPGSYRVVIGP